MTAIFGAVFVLPYVIPAAVSLSSGDGANLFRGLRPPALGGQPLRAPTASS